MDEGWTTDKGMVDEEGWLLVIFAYLKELLDNAWGKNKFIKYDMLSDVFFTIWL